MRTDGGIIELGTKVLYRRADGLADIGIVERVRAYIDTASIRAVFYVINGESIEENRVIKKIDKK